MKNHFLYYISLIAVLFIGFSLFLYLNGQKQLQMSIIVFASFFYALLGIVHHIFHHSVSARVVLEYISIAVLGISIIFFVLQVGI